MGRINYEKERMKAYLKADIESCITNITYESNEMQQLISVLANYIAGSAIGADQRINSHCNNVLLDYSRALTQLYQCSGLAEQLNTEDEDSDE